MKLICDYLVVGGGSAGCVMASRLSENSSAQVILVEAGPDDQTHEVRSGRFLTYNRPPYYWELSDEKGLPFGQPKILGGGSALNAMHAQRGYRADYDEWRQLGVQGWDYEALLPFFARVEKDQLAATQDGQVSIHRVARSGWSGLSKAIAASLSKRGYPELKNINESSDDGYGAVPLTYEGKERASSASAYLTDAVRARPNLKILTGYSAQKIIFEGMRARGIEVLGTEGIGIIEAGETIMCCGGVFSPALLLRSGIGPAAELAALGITPQVDRPGVGKNLQNHPMLFIGAHLTPEGRQDQEAVHPCPFVVRYSSNDPRCPQSDMLLNVWERIPGRLEWDPTGQRIAILNIIVNKAYSIGEIGLNPVNPLGMPTVTFNFLKDPRDLSRMVDGLRFLASLVNEAEVARTVDYAFAPTWKPLALTMMGHGAKAQMLSSLGAIGLSGPKSLRHLLLKDMGISLSALAQQSDEEIGNFIKTYMLPAYHVSGSCRMGASYQKETVVDSNCRVVGVDSLRVVDASIFPTLMRAGLNLPVMMAAEKIAADIMAHHHIHA